MLRRAAFERAAPRTCPRPPPGAPASRPCALPSKRSAPDGGRHPAPASSPARRRLIVLHILLEALQALGEIAHDFGDLTAPEQQHEHENQDQNMRETQTHRLTLLHGAARLAGNARMLPIAAFDAAGFTKKWQKSGVKATYVRKNPGDGRSRPACRQIFIMPRRCFPPFCERRIIRKLTLKRKSIANGQNYQTPICGGWNVAQPALSTPHIGRWRRRGPAGNVDFARGKFVRYAALYLRKA